MGAEPPNDGLFRLLISGVREYAIYMLAPDGRVMTWNEGAERIKGYRADEIVGRHFSVFYPDADVRDGRCERELAVTRQEGRYSDEGWRIRKDGSRFWASIAIDVIRGDDGGLIGFSKITRDMTDRKHAAEDQAARLSAEERFRLIVDSVRDYAIFMLDAGGHVATWNRGAERIKGYRADEIIGRHFSTFYPESDVRAGKCERELEVAAREGRFEDEGWRVRKDGSRFWANVVISAIRNNDGLLRGFSKVTRDLTDRRRAEESKAAQHAAEQANRAKDEFLAMLGHELRNPMAPILTALQLLKLRGDARSSREHEVIERQVKHMMTLIDDLLDISRIARGKIDLKRRRVDLRDVLARATEIASPLLEQREHHFEIDVPPDSIVVDGDPARLTQVFSNLLTNAAKYTPPGGHIHVTIEPDDDDVMIEIRDDGVGIPPELMPRIFDLFVQGYQDSDRSGGGLGLGLTVVRALVEMHGGSVNVRNADEGRGTIFTIHLPRVDAPPASDPGLQPLAPGEVVRRRVLLVDDNTDAVEMLGEALRTLGCEVKTAGDGAAALAVIEHFAPEVAVLDIGLPVMDGYELARHIREMMRERTPRLIALTGYGQGRDIERAHRAGFDEHMVKPIELTRLLESIRRP